MTRQCPVCRAPGRSGDQFCAACGSPLGPSTVSTGPLRPFVLPFLAAPAPYRAITPEPAPLSVAMDRAHLADQADVAVLVGSAADGLPLVLHVRRRMTVESMVRTALGARSGTASRLVTAPGAALDWLEQAIDEQAHALGLLAFAEEQVYRSGRSLPALAGQTLLSQAAGPASRLPDAYPSATVPPIHMGRTDITGGADAAEGIATPRIGSLHLAVPLRAGPVDILQINAFSQPLLNSRRLFLEEDLLPLASARFHCLGEEQSEPAEGRPADRDAYQAAIAGAVSIWWTVGRHDLVAQIATLAERLGEMHAAGRVHADIKPANVLITWEGAAPIDAVNVAAGSVSPLATPGWGAPELMLSRPAVPATDVYALGLLLASLLQATLYGEERTFIRPGNGPAPRRLSLLSAPEVLIDSDAIAIDTAVLAEWQALISRCLAFDPKDRPANGSDLAAAIRALLERAELPGGLPVTGGPGRLHTRVTINEKVQPAWVMQDAW